MKTFFSTLALAATLWAVSAEDFYTGLLGPVVINTNFISGQLYTNNWKQNIRVEAGASNVIAAAAGNTKLEFWCYPQTGSGPTGITNRVQCFHKVTETDKTNNVPGLGGVVPPGHVFTYTNQSTGSGNTASPEGGQITLR